MINMGPQHPSTHGVLRLVLELDGETVVSAATTVGYLHTGIEKTIEQKKFQQVIPLVERMDYLSAMSNSFSFALSVEKLLGIEVPDRVKWIRVLLVELQRINSHLVWLGTHGMELGAVTVMLYCFRERELLLNIHELVAGFRMFPSYIRVGGLREDLPSGFHQAVSEVLDRMPGKLEEYENLLTKNQIYLKRTRGVGRFSKDDAVAWGLVGPIARASGVDYDVRKTFPYGGYDTFEFDVPLGARGDVYDRYLVRMEEMRQSVRIIAQCLDQMPAGPINIADGKIVLPPKHKVMTSMEELIHQFMLVTQGVNAPPGEIYFGHENPKGELGFYINSRGGGTPYRLKIRSPSFVNLSILSHLLPGHMMSDTVAILGSFDFVMGECDR